MFSETVVLRGHIIDSLILPKVLDQILTQGGDFKIGEIKIGQNRVDQSYAGSKSPLRRTRSSMTSCFACASTALR